MCWKTIYCPVKQVAKRDIKVAKFIVSNKYGGDFFTPYYKQEVYMGQIKASELGEPNRIGDVVDGFYAISEGLHSYGTNVDIVVQDNRIDIISNGQRLDYWFDTYNGNKVYIAECVIPKGSYYYINERNEYVSNKLKYVNVVSSVENSITLFNRASVLKMEKLMEFSVNRYLRYDVDRVGENAIEIAFNILEAMQELDTCNLGRGGLISNYIMEWAKEAEQLLKSPYFESDEISYYDFIDQFSKQKLEEFKENR